MSAPHRHDAGPAATRGRPLLVTGGAGFIGANLVDLLCTEGHDVLVYDALVREGTVGNAHWLKARWGAQVSVIEADVRDHATLVRAAREAAAVFHLAAQVAVTTSLTDPIEDFEVNLAGTVTLLDALRRAGGRVPLVFASTNKVYGGLADVSLEVRGDAYEPIDPHYRRLGVGEGRPLDFHTPYGCSKGAADQYVLDFSRCFGVPTVVLRKSCVYGQRQMGTEDQGWVAHFAICALDGRPVTIYGDGRQVRDLLDVRDTVEAYVQAWRQAETVHGQAFNLGGGPENAASLREVLAHLEQLTDRTLHVEFADWRPGDQRWYVSDPRRARTTLGLPAFRAWKDGVADLVTWLAAERGMPLPASRHAMDGARAARAAL